MKIRANLKDLSFRYKQPVLPMCLRDTAPASRIVREQLASYCELETVPRKPLSEPLPHGRLGDSFGYLRSLPSIVETLAGFFINVRRRLHSRMMRSRRREVSQKVSKFFKALPGQLIARNAGAGLTGSVPALFSQENMVGKLEIRAPRMNDIEAIIEVVRSCAPFLTAHISYIYWMTIRYHAHRCAVAEIDGELVGWCSVAQVSGNKYFSHQTAVAPTARGLGVAHSLWAHVLSNLKVQPEFELEFTLNRRNDAALKLMTAVAERAGMRLIKRSEVVELFEEGTGEELYVMAPAPGPQTLPRVTAIRRIRRGDRVWSGDDERV
ncbi:MAG: GNAT family N-acetyltransferase [Bryobacteraceae bacterium]